jgi:hypothetical protein
MSEETSPSEVKWWNKKLLARSALVGLAFYGLFWALAERAKPPEGHVFERLPTISGIYKCCDAGGRYSQSWVGGIGVDCLGFSYYHIGTGRNDCGLKEKLNGLVVEADRVLVPAYDGPLPLISKITSGGYTYYEQSDQRIRELWISGSNGGASTLGWLIFLIVHFIQLVYFDRKFKKSQGDKA